MSNIQVTHDATPNNARSESNIAINPNQPMQIVVGSKKFRDINTYDFTLATAYSADGGLMWHDSADLMLHGGTLLTDPALAWDDIGNVYLVGLLGNNPPNFNTVGIVIYKSADGGQTWSAPKRIHDSVGDDKQWAAGDTTPASPFHGRVYAVWDDGSDMRFAHTLDHGVTYPNDARRWQVANTHLGVDRPKEKAADASRAPAALKSTPGADADAIRVSPGPG